MWQFVGSNDEQCGKLGNWTILCEDKSKADFSQKYLTKYCNVDDEIVTAFRCLGIRVLNSVGKDGASLRDVRMWRKGKPQEIF